MTFTVTWKSEAEEHLASIWLETFDRNGVAAAANAIDRRLKISPESGVHRFDSIWTVIVSPLGVTYEIIDDDRRVVVLNVWRVDADDDTIG